MPIIDSPLRYPGGKTKLYKMISGIIKQNRNKENCIYVEPFAGGSGLALRLLFKGDVDYIVLNDIDYGIYCFWNSCLNRTDELCAMIEGCDVNLDNWNIQKNIYDLKQFYSDIEIGFATFYLNRCNVSGIIKGGPIGGKQQTGNYKIDARFNKRELVNKIKKIGSFRNCIEFYNLDATDFLLNVACQFPKEELFLNIDPPYVNKGSMLYENSFKHEDHAQLANIIKTLEYDWIVTYDKCNFINELFIDFRQDAINLNYSAGQTKSGEELVIYGNTLCINK